MLKFIFGFLRSLFAASRPGLDSFLKSNLDYVKMLIRQEWNTISADGFHETKQKLFVILKNRFPGIPDTFISILLDFAFDHVKVIVEKEAGKLR